MLKRLGLILMLMLCQSYLFAQTTFFQPFSLGAGYGITVAKAGEQTLTSSNAVELNLAYQFTPFYSITLEGQIGQLTGGDALHDTYSKQFVNNYNAVILHADLQLGELINYDQSPFLNVVKDFYFGTGLGILSNKISSIQTVSRDTNYKATFTYLPSSTNIIVPIRLGYEFKIFNGYNEPQYRFDINYTFNTAFSAGLDGYSNPYSSSIKYYNYISVSFKFGFGHVKQYRKAVYPAYF